MRCELLFTGNGRERLANRRGQMRSVTTNGGGGGGALLQTVDLQEIHPLPPPLPARQGPQLRESRKGLRVSVRPLYVFVVLESTCFP